MYNDITGILLSGGKSSRMGMNKSFLKLGSKYVVEVIYEVMAGLFRNVLVITNEPERYSELGYITFADIYKDKGPLGGIHSGLIHSGTEKNFILSCDMPLINESVLRFIIDYPLESDIKVAFADNFIQQLCGLYSKSLIPGIESELLKESDSNKCSVLNILESSGSAVINIEKEMNNYPADSFMNMNNRENYLYAKKLFALRY